MMRLTGTLLFSLLCLLPLGAEGVTKTPPLKQCPSGTKFCETTGKCVPLDSYPTSCPTVVLHLKKKEGTIYSLEEGTIVTCEGDRALLPLTVGGETHWTCGNPEKKQ